MKKRLILVMALLFVTSFVAAQSYGGYYGNDLGANLGFGMEQLINNIEQMFGPLFSVFLGGYGDYMFERILFLFIMISVIYVVVSRMDVFKQNRAVIWIITLSISLLSTRFLTESDLVRTMILPYSVLGVSLTAVLPIMIYFTFVQSFSESATLRKILWIFFIIVFVGLWASRYDELGQLSWIYLMTAIAAVIFLLFDGTIRRAIVRNKMKELNIDNRENFMVEIRRQLKELQDNYREGFMTETQYNRMNKKLNKQLTGLMKN